MTTADQAARIQVQDPSEHFVDGNHLRLLHNGSAAFPEMLSAIAGATQQVLLEMYWFGSDSVGQKFADALIAAAQRGVEVSIIYDAVGSVGASDDMFEALQRAGARVIEFNPIAPWKRRFRLSKLTRRDHRKILVVDGRVGFTGGINLADYWLPREEGGAGWRDDMVRIDGPAVQGLCDCFARVWSRLRARSRSTAAFGRAGRPCKCLASASCARNARFRARTCTTCGARTSASSSRIPTSCRTGECCARCPVPRAAA